MNRQGIVRDYHIDAPINAVTFLTAKRGLGGATARAYWAGPQPDRPLLVVPNVTGHPSVASVPITVLLYNGPLFYSFYVAIKGLQWLCL